MNVDLQKLPKSEVLSIVTERIETLTGVSGLTAQSYADSIYQYYSRTDTFPKSSTLLDVSIRALVSGLKTNKLKPS